MRISIIGTGYVGLVTGTCLADFGLQVTCVDKDDSKIKLLNSGKVPIYEPNLETLIQKNVSAGRLSFSPSPQFLHPGPGFGGSCFPKDTEALCSIAESFGYEFKTLQAVISANKRQRELMVEKIKHLLGDLKDKTIGVLGLAFKQNTDDIRKSPSIDII